ncbi:MAG: ABC transporter substrate-binding protein [Clostridiales bacterium]
MKKIGKLKLVALLLTVLMTLGVLVGCSSKTAVDPDSEVILAGARDLAPGEKDAYYTSSILKIWEPLVGVNDAGEPIPVLAKEWMHSDDYKVWTFKLVENVKFHDGTTFNADVVVKNFDRYTSMKTKSSPFYTFDVSKIYPNLEKVEAGGENEVKLSFTEPFSTLIYSMTNFGSAMFSPECFDKTTGDFTGIVQGTGPFKLMAHEKDQYAVLQRNEEYYGEKAGAKNIRVKVIPSAETRYSALKSEEIMGVLDLGSLTPALTNELLKDEKYAVSTADSTINHYIHTNGTKAPFNDPKMKKALSLLIDREKIVNDFFYGYATPTVNFLNQVSPFYKEEKQDVDVEQAKKLANEVLQGQTAEVSFIIPQYGIDRYPYKEIVEYLQSELKQIGLNASITILDGAAYKAAQKAGNYDLAIGTQGLPNFEPAMLFKNYMGSNGSTNKAYCLGYNNEKVDALLKTLDVTQDMAERGKIYDALQDIAVSDPATTPIFGDVNLGVYNKKLDHYNAAIYGITLDQVKWAK